MTKLYSVKLWTLGGHCDLDLWPKYSFQTCYFTNTNYLQKIRLPPTLTLEISRTQIWRRTHTQTDRQTHKKSVIDWDMEIWGKILLRKYSFDKIHSNIPSGKQLLRSRVVMHPSLPYGENSYFVTSVKDYTKTMHIWYNVCNYKVS